MLPEAPRHPGRRVPPSEFPPPKPSHPDPVDPVHADQATVIHQIAHQAHIPTSFVASGNLAEPHSSTVLLRSQDPVIIQPLCYHPLGEFPLSGYKGLHRHRCRTRSAPSGDVSRLHAGTGSVGLIPRLELKRRAQSASAHACGPRLACLLNSRSRAR